MCNPCKSVFQTLAHGNSKNETEEGKKRGVSMERSKPVRKKEIPTAYPNLSKHNNNKHNILVFNKIWKKKMKFN